MLVEGRVCDPDEANISPFQEFYDLEMKKWLLPSFARKLMPSRELERIKEREEMDKQIKKRLYLSVTYLLK